MIKTLVLTVILSIGLFFSFYHLPQQYVFEYDRETDYNQVKSIVVGHKYSLVGPTVNAFIYLAPWYYLSQIPFFILFAGNPIFGAYLIGSINFGVYLLTYFLVEKLTKSRLTAFCSAVIWVGSANRINWIVPSLPLFFLIFVLLYEQLYRRKTILLAALLTLVWSLSLNFHPQMIFLLPAWVFAIFNFLFKTMKTQRPKSLLLIFLAFLIPVFPLIIFDLRHNFLDTRAIIHFLTSSSGKGDVVSRFRLFYSLRQFSIPIALPFEWLKHNILFSLLLISVGTLFTIKNRHYFYLLIISICSLFLMGFYSQRTWPEYYHLVGGFSVMLLIIIAIGRVRILRLILLFLSLVLTWSNFHYLTSYADPTSYYYKRQIILYMLAKNQPYDKMNIDNDFPFGEGLGFGPIREYYEKPSGQYPPSLKFYVSYADNPKHNPTKQVFGAYGVSIIQ